MPTIRLPWHLTIFSIVNYRAIRINLSLLHHLRGPSKSFFTREQHWISTQLHAHPRVYAEACYSWLQRCTNLKQLQQIHAHIHICGLEQSISLGTKLVNKYVECDSLKNARQVFDKMPERNKTRNMFDKVYKRNILLWNAMLAGYAGNRLSEEALALYYQMQMEGMPPDDFTFSILLKACAGLSTLQEGKKIHSHILRRMGLESDVLVVTGLVDMYVKCGSIDDARQVFDKMPERNVVSWTAMIRGYLQNGRSGEALKLFNQMRLGEAMPNAYTVVNAVSACIQLGALQQGSGGHLHGGFLLQ